MTFSSSLLLVEPLAVESGAAEKPGVEVGFLGGVEGGELEAVRERSRKSGQVMIQ